MQQLLTQFEKSSHVETRKKSLWRFDKLVKTYERSTGKQIRGLSDLDELSAWCYEIQGRHGYMHLRAASWNRFALSQAMKMWHLEGSDE